jgi:predicted dehydrogenase
VGFNRRFDMGNRRVRAAVPVDATADLVLRIAYRRASWRAHAVRDDALLDLGPHVADLAAWLTGSPVHAVRGASVAPDRVHATFVLAHGEATVDLACDRAYRERVELYDGRGARLARHALGGPRAAVHDRVLRPPHPLVVTLAAEIEALVRAVRGEGRGALADAGDAVAAMAVLDATRASAAAAGAVVAVTTEDPACS